MHKIILYKNLYCRFSVIKFPSTRFFSDEFPKPVQNRSIQKVDEVKPDNLNNLPIRQAEFGGLSVQYWNERRAVRNVRKLRFSKAIKNSVDAVRFLQALNNFPVTPLEWMYYFKRRSERNQLLEQTFLIQRLNVLKADLAAAHFIVNRGGSVKFLGKSDWVGVNEKVKHLPVAYVPGMLIEKIKAEGTGLLFEGLKNIGQLRYLTYLSLKNLDTINDWCLEWISSEYFLNLKHLDISGCKNVTHRGLSCFYKFENLEILEVEGIPDTTEFKLACLMLLEIMPNLEIMGVNLSIPEKIEAVNSETARKIPNS